MKAQQTYQKTALIITLLLIILSAGSLIYLMLPAKSGTEYTADIYQDGILIMSIPLNGSGGSQIFTIEGENGCVNEIETRSGSIGIISADCPDKLCVRQGFISSSKLPITCLPNRLVIRLRPSYDEFDADVPDAAAY